MIIKDYSEESKLCLEASGWQPIDTAPRDGTLLWVYVAPYSGLPGFQTTCAYHPDAGFCADELREVTHWKPLTLRNRLMIVLTKLLRKNHITKAQ